jgi:hypothetical protein
MRILRVISLLIIIGGGALFFLGDYITKQVGAGKEQIVQGQTKVNRLRRLSSLSPYTRDVGGMVADSGQKKIEAGKKEVKEYEELIKMIYLGSYALVAFGLMLLLISFFKKRRS